MARMKLEAVARPHDPAPASSAARRTSRPDAPSTQDDARGGELFRGLAYGVPIGLAMWLFLAALLWRFA